MKTIRTSRRTCSEKTQAAQSTKRVKSIVSIMHSTSAIQRFHRCSRVWFTGQLIIESMDKLLSQASSTQIMPLQLAMRRSKGLLSIELQNRQKQPVRNCLRLMGWDTRHHSNKKLSQPSQRELSLIFFYPVSQQRINDLRNR